MIQMTQSLRARIALHVAMLVIASLAIAIGAGVGIQQLHRDIDVAGRGYRQIREVYEVGYSIVAARDALRRGEMASAIAAVESASVRLRSSGADAPLEESQKQASVASAEQLLGALRRNDLPVAEIALNRLLGELAETSARIRRTVAEYEDAAERHRRATFRHVCVTAAIMLAVGVIVGMRLYRSVMRPLDRLARGVRHFASGRLHDRLATDGDREFAALANDFNAMARELEGLYNDLEQRVQTKSRQLVQSERLASVGYLAAGVAHEINNPLGIIAGYGERSLQLLRRSTPLNDETASSIDRSIGIICDEAFRCKQITDRLLMLARPGKTTRERVSLERVAGDVITSVGGLSRFADRGIRLTTDEHQPLLVLASEGEMRQVLLSLVVNALEAVDPVGGEVQVTVAARDDIVEVCVTDNGCGIPPDALPQVFEPFFTDKRGERPGTGLGLSVAHAIVRDCKGEIEAHSDGLGRGSRFVVRLPRAKEEVADVHAH